MNINFTWRAIALSLILFCTSATVSTAQVALACNDQVNISLDEFCEAEVTVDMILEGDASALIGAIDSISGLASGVTTITAIGEYTVTVSEPDGNKCWGTILVEDKVAPEFTVLPITVACVDGIPTVLEPETDVDSAVYPEPDASDCGCQTFTYEDAETSVDADCGQLYDFVRTWYCEDAAGNKSAGVPQLITVEPITLADVTLPTQSVTLSCGDSTDPADMDAADGFPTVGDLPLDNNVCNLFAEYSDQKIDACGEGCSGAYKIIRTWTLINWCDATDNGTYVQTISTKDTTAPSVSIATVDPAVQYSVNPWGCTADGPLPVPTLSDNCTDAAEVTYTVSGPAGVTVTATDDGFEASGMPVGINTFVYTASDCCGNIASSTYDLYIEDLTPPVAISKEYVVVSLTGFDNDGVAKVYAPSIDNGSHDGDCGSVIVEIRRPELGVDEDYCGFADNEVYGDFVKFCCDDLGETHDVMLRVTDEAGNYNETWASVLVEDKTTPVIVCPADATVECTDTELEPGHGFGFAVATGICGELEVEHSDSFDSDVCATGVLTRTWSIVDYPSITCDQIITIENNEIFSGVDFPEDSLVYCMDVVADLPTWDEGACDLIGLSIKSDTFYLSGNSADAACIKIINEYAVIDWCTGYKYYGTQVISVLDDVAPVILAEDVCIAITDGCTEDVAITATVSDSGDCPSQTFVWEVDIDYNNDWVTDDTQTGEGSEFTVEIDDMASSKATHRLVWKVGDGCGNIASATSTFQAFDKKKPTPYCYSVSSAIMESTGAVTLWACDFVLSSEDNCSTEFKYTFDLPADGEAPETVDGWIEENQCQGKAFACPTDGNVVMLSVYTWDECNNYEVCYVELTLSGCGDSDEDEVEGNDNGRIAGAVGTESNVMVQDVNVQITSNQPEYPMSIMTDASGQYASDSHVFTANYSVTALKNDDHRNGVSTLDILLIQRHILNLTAFTSPYQYISADANNDQLVSAADLVDIRKLVLEIYDEFPSNNSWRFADATQSLSTANAFAFNEVIDILGLNADMTSENFIANKIGDVNGSVVLSATGNTTEVRNGQNLNMNLTGVTTAEGVSVEVTSANFSDILGYQFTMNTNGLELVSVDAGSLDVTDENVAVLDASTITMSWNAVEAVSVSNEVLFTLNFAGSEVSDVAGMTINSDATIAEAYDSNLSIMNVVMGAEATSEFALAQNEPNPFTAQTVIEFSLPTAGAATLTVMDVTGKVVTQLNGNYAKGLNSVTLKKVDLATSGVLYYQLESGEFTATRKMIITE